MQAKLLRVLQGGTYERVGGAETLRCDVRVIAATNRDLEREVAEGTFRADLYYRLSVFPIRVPPLRERREDIPQLVRHFVAKHARRLGRGVDSVSARLLKRFAAKPWPGNVRELENAVERALIISSGGVLDLWEPVGSPARGDEDQTLKAAERRHVLSVLSQTGWVIEGEGGAAEVLGLKPSTLRSLMKRRAPAPRSRRRCEGGFCGRPDEPPRRSAPRRPAR